MDCVLHLIKCPETSTVASTRIARWLSKLLDIPLVDRENMVNSYRNVLFVNSGSAFCDFLSEVAEIIEQCKRMVWIQNDYTIYPPTQVRKVMNQRDDLIVERWSTIPKLPNHYAKLKIWTRLPLQATEYINWNKLTYKLLKRKQPTEEGLFYYGAYRQDREELFKTYFGLPTLYDIIISASKKAEKKFEDLNLIIDFIGPMKNLVEDMQQFQATIYLEDFKSNSIYCSPANRFYECLSAGVPILFDKSCVNTMACDGFNVIPYIVNCQSDVAYFLRNQNRLDEISDLQSNEWCCDYVKELTDSVLKAYDKIK